MFILMTYDRREFFIKKHHNNICDKKHYYKCFA